MLRGLADEVGGKVETPQSLFPDFPKATPLAASPSWAAPLQKAPPVQAPLMPAPQESESHKTVISSYSEIFQAYTQLLDSSVLSMIISRKQTESKTL